MVPNNQANADLLRRPLLNLDIMKNVYQKRPIQLIARKRGGGNGEVNMVRTTLLRSDQPLLPLGRLLHHANECWLKCLILGAGKSDEKKASFEQFKVELKEKIDEMKEEKVTSEFDVARHNWKLVSGFFLDNY